VNKDVLYWTNNASYRPYTPVYVDFHDRKWHLNHWDAVERALCKRSLTSGGGARTIMFS